MDQQQAQSRADRIHAFAQELAELGREGVLDLPADVRARLDAHHADLLRRLTAEYDIDISSGQKRLSWGMRIASFLGALALSAAVFFFFYRFWGALETWMQVAFLIAAPLLATLGVEVAARRERSFYFASLVALVAVACFVLNVSVLGQIFNITPSQNAFLVWGAFALLLAYAYGLRLILVAGLTSLLGYLSATVGTWSGAYWLSFGERPENFILGGAALFAAGLLRHGARPGFAGIYRVYGLLVIFIAILILSNWGRVSYLPWSGTAIEYSYQTVGFVLAGLTIWLGIRRRWSGVANLGSTFFVLYLYTKLFDWWWDWMPKYAFFFVLGLIAILLLLVMRRVRTGGREAVA
ncbi:MAG: DUF2157 domain-containing protein [Gammaproteobacteria bacterium]|nr:DUF2157 domain-containing protein [Gammaproteobacteria bacterium]NIR31783.1 DUF2157 domain-containing protein [Gammaproteobacteria bacterium]NIR98714.1 DUF2157 domain-containing protein [Gammaproteobacteria bacterium]NIT64431.1 DUF2157 domain-containing protein [Gammaproteobacteria bacterium]NIV20846.1 DUF2157 domain-containing protein [Gammaproteobacteria bacterium]